MKRAAKSLRRFCRKCFAAGTKRSLNVVAALVLVLPGALSAQVVISEVMYDLPTGSDSDREWIEIFNSGAASVRLTDWKLFEANTNHGLAAFQGGEDIASGAYAVIADNPVKFLIDWPTYTGLLFDSAFGLSNAGETLILRCCGSDLIDKDSITYGADAGGAGDGSSLQRGSVSAAALVAVAPTPGAGTLVAETSGSDTQATSTETATTTSQTQQTQTNATSAANSAPVSSYVAPPLPQIFVDAGGDQTVITAADVEFNARAYNRDKEPIERVRFLWNFGDGSVGEGPAVVHHFEYPGRYAVVVNIAEDRYAASDQLIITAEPARFAFSVLSDGGVSIENLAGRDLDLSRWIVRSFGREFFLPEYSVILAGSAMHISQKTLGFLSTEAAAELAYPNGVVALRAGEMAADAPPAPLPHTSTPTTPSGSAGVPYMSPSAAYSGGEDAEEIEEPYAADTTSSESTSSAQAAAAAASGALKWWLGAIALAGVSGAALIAARRFRKGEWDITEEK